MKILTRTVLLLVLLVPSARAEWSAEYLLGDAWEPRTPVRIRQEGFEDLVLDARFRTEPFRIPPYWSARVIWWRGNTGWAVDLVHHKTHDPDPRTVYEILYPTEVLKVTDPPEIRYLGLTHGYNLGTFQILKRRGPWHGLIGLGGVLAHPESTIRGRRHPETGGILLPGQYLAGPAFLLGAGVRVGLVGPLFLNAETRISFSSVDAPVRDGELSLRHTGFHLAAGLGLRY